MIESDENMLVKQCSKCKTVLPATDFNVDRSRKSGLHSCCKRCEAAYYADNIEHITQRRKSNRAEACTYFKRWYVANKVQHLANNRRWRLEHLEQARGLTRAWAILNPERGRDTKRRRRARKAGAEHNDLTQVQWQATLQAYGNKCAYSAVFAGHTQKLHQEHVVPLVRGGDHTLENIMPVCSGCNASKGTKTALEFLLDRIGAVA